MAVRQLREKPQKLAERPWNAASLRSVQSRGEFRLGTASSKPHAKWQLGRTPGANPKYRLLAQAPGPGYPRRTPVNCTSPLDTPVRSAL